MVELNAQSLITNDEWIKSFELDYPLLIGGKLRLAIGELN